MSNEELLILSKVMNAGGGGGGDITVESLSVTENGVYTAPPGKAYSPVNVNVPEPSGIKFITNTNVVDVSAYAQAKVQDSSLIAENIKKNVSILGVVGTLEGGGSDALNKLISRIIGPTFIVSNDLDKLGFYSFYGCNNLISVDFSNANENLSIYNNAFDSCENLVLNEIIAKNICAEAFTDCINLSVSGKLKLKSPTPDGTLGRNEKVADPTMNVTTHACFNGCNLEKVFIDDSIKYIYSNPTDANPVLNRIFGGSGVKHIYSPYSSKPSTWPSYFNYVTKTEFAVTHWGVSEEEFDAL